MQRQDITSLADGHLIDEVYLLTDKQLRANRNAETYLLAQLRDSSGQISGLLWNVRDDIAAAVAPGELVRVRGRAQLYQGNLQLILTNVSPAPDAGFRPEDFLPAGTADTGRLVERLNAILRDIRNPAINALAASFLGDAGLMERFVRAPAGIRLHHAFPGGLLEHVVNVLETADRIQDLFPTVDFDLLKIGIFLHDIGKVRELEFDSTFSYSHEGQLMGHLVQGVEMLNERVQELETSSGQPFPTETLLRIKHMIVSHHGSYEFGSPKLPMTPEAIALHYLDNLDAKINEFQSLIESDPNSESVWTPYNANLQRKIFKGVSVSE
jgi:3'-5' exoribonuclease